MFDKTVLSFSDSGPSYSRVDVTVKNAPTHESVKLLREMEQTAKSEVEKTLRLENNTMAAVICRLNSIEWGERGIRVFFVINNQKLEVTSSTPEFYTVEQRVEKLVEDVSRKIAQEVVMKSISESKGAFDEVFK
ncbi:hypothetical protein PP940_gp188 [Rhizobium phage RL2RES]|uniref:Uncharacterized protein n=1 Tax=Rhizobium phage RL2RES TaxID=103371 RepID=A0A6B9J625_9CAUD|nr:hypothetical protein PP940_gp188 [Rhizobium phage RL2RES]QGZ14215.1 hypothetical protein RL2RES_188 [Rhizobium phage RL2RES]